MKKIIRKLFTVILLTALLLTGLRFGPDLYARVFGGGRVQWISERFSETLKEKNHLVVYEVETTGQETVTQDAWLFGTVQKVVVPYAFQMSYTVDLSCAVISTQGTEVQVRVPAPVPGYQKLTVDESQVQKVDWLYPLTPERYAEIRQTIEDRLFEDAKANPEYAKNAWAITVRDLENLFQAVVESAGAGSACTVSISPDNTAGALPFTSAKD